MNHLDLFDFANKNLRHVRSLTDQEAVEYRSRVVRLVAFRQARKLILLVKHNQLDLEREASGAVQVLQEADSLGAARDKIDLQVNRRLVNYLTAMRLFLDHTEARLKRTYGKDSSVATALKARCAQAYDDAFSYRFLYRLRNFAQHCALPIGHVSVHSRLADPAAKRIEREVALSFDAGFLLEHGANVWGNLREEIETRRPGFDVLPLVREATDHLTAIERFVVATEKPFLQRIAEKIFETVADVAKVGGVPAVGLVEGGDGISQVQLVQPPPDIMRWLGITTRAIEF